MPFESTQRGNAKSASSMLENYLLLVTTNDSNVRLVDWAEKTTFVKYKGGLNESLQTHATSSECNRFIITGTDDGAVVMWEMGHFDKPLWIMPSSPPARTCATPCTPALCPRRDNKTGLYPPITAACFAPTSTVRVLLESAEDLYQHALQAERRFDSMSSVENDRGSWAPSPGAALTTSTAWGPLYREEDGQFQLANCGLRRL